VGHGAQRAKREQRGAALVEFSIVAVLLFTLILGVLVYGILLSKKQTVVQAANEAARAVVPMTYDGSGTSLTAIQNAAKAQLSTSLLNGTDRSCTDSMGTTCTVTVDHCTGSTGPWCVFVTATLDNKNHPLVVPIPFLSAINPDTLVGQASAQLNP
jgi:Flp pilus assembly protein TadG